MGYTTRVQVIARKNGQRQFYLICPAPLAEALELRKSEEIEWVIADRATLQIRRKKAVKSQKER